MNVMPKPDLTHAPADHPEVRFGKIGVLLANLGTPDHYSYWPMRRYLNEFLSDRRVIDYFLSGEYHRQHGGAIRPVVLGGVGGKAPVQQGTARTLVHQESERAWHAGRYTVRNHQHMHGVDSMPRLGSREERRCP